MICVKIKTLEPIHLAASRDVSSFSSTLDYIPGTTFRGALARPYLEQQGGEVDEIFNRTFLNPDNWFSPLYPLGEEFLQDAYVIPMTAYSCKYHPGFTPKGHGVVDLLPHYLDEQTVFVPKCSECNADLSPFRGFYSNLGESAPSHWIQVKKRFLTKSALDSRTETAAESQLYTAEVIEEGQNFIGFISCQGEKDCDLLEELFLEDFFDKQKTLQIGSSKSRGLGQVEVISAEYCDDGLFHFDDHDFDYRMLSFNQMLDKNGIDRAGFTFFSLSLLTDCIVQDDFLRSVSGLSANILSRYYSSEFEQVELIHQFAAVKAVESWNALHHLPRPARIAIQAGSVFVYRIKKGNDEIVDLLKKLETRGIGERKTEGFGRVIINHPFHFKGEVY